MAASLDGSAIRRSSPGREICSILTSIGSRKRVRAARGTNLSVSRADHMIHDWMLMPSPEAKVAVTAIADLLRSAAAMSPGIDAAAAELTTS